MKITHPVLVTVVALVLAAATTGCSNPSGDDTTSDASQTEDHGHPHPHEEDGHSHGDAPHDGTLADWGGGKYHVEFTVDHDKQEATVYVLGDDAKTAYPITSEEIQLSIESPKIQIALKPMPQEGDPEGTASRFVGNHEGLGVVQEYEGTMMGVIDDTPYSGQFKEESHAHDE